MNDSTPLINEIRDFVKARANEISNRLSKEDVDAVKEVLEMIDDLESSLEEFEGLISNAWDAVEQF